MKKNIVYLLMALMLISCGFLRQDNRDRVCFKNKCFEVELALTIEEQMQGLMNRQSLSYNKGMLFIFSENAIHKFWMKNTLIALDMIWIDESRKVVFIEENVQPCVIDDCDSYGPDSKIKYVLEVNAGMAKEIKLKVGDILRFDLKLKK